MDLRKRMTTLAVTTTLAGLATLGLTVPAQATEAGPVADVSSEWIAAPTSDADGNVSADAAKPFSLTVGTPAALPKSCASPDLWKPYPRKIGRDWYVEAGGRLYDCGFTHLSLELQKNGHQVDKKTVTRKGDINPRYKCRNFKKTNYTIVATWWKPVNHYPGFEIIQKWVSRSPEHLNCS
ncbi:hypothetical protein [Streptomyces sp. NPDC059161]|uniref:hypothetical protein n=1 Tax=unclassified Streptomyces TaxID=2593676 RepID=UPI00365A9A38